MRTQREVVNGKHTGAHWFAGRRIAHCFNHPKRWIIEGENGRIYANGFMCGCAKNLDVAVRIIQQLARPNDPETIERVRHLKLVVSR